MPRSGSSRRRGKDLADPSERSHRRRGRRSSGKKNKREDEEDIPEDGEAGETVVHVQCPNCRKLFKNRDGFCPYCDADLSVTPQKPAFVHRPEGLEPKYFSIYGSLVLTVLSGIFFLYYLVMPATGGGIEELGFVLFPFAVFLVILLVLLFIVLKRSRVNEGVRSKLVISGLLGLMLTGFIIGVGKVGQFFVEGSGRNAWLEKAETLHNLFIILALFSLILLAGYIFLLNYRKNNSGDQV